MKLGVAIKKCKADGYIYRTSNTSYWPKEYTEQTLLKIKNSIGDKQFNASYKGEYSSKKYYKNHEKTILERILEDFGNKGLYFKDYEIHEGK